MDLIKFLESHDNALKSCNEIVSIVADGNYRVGSELISLDEIMEETDKIKLHFKLLENELISGKELHGRQTND